MSIDDRKKTVGTTIWLNDLQYQKLQDAESDLEEVFERTLTHGEAIMATALISKAFMGFFKLGSKAIDLDKLDFDKIINFETLQKAGMQIPEDALNQLGGQIERVFIQLEALGFLRSQKK